MKKQDPKWRLLTLAIFIALLTDNASVTYSTRVDASSPPIDYGSRRTGESKPANFVLTLPWAEGVTATGLGSGYGQNLHSDADSYAMDFDLPSNTDIVAAAPGIVIWANYDSSGYGKSVLVAHTGPGSGYVSLYGHLNSMDSRFDNLPSGGIPISRGDHIGQQGMTGLTCDPACPHLHFALYKITDASLRSVGANTYPGHLKTASGSIAVIPEPILGDEAYENLFWLSPESGYQTSMPIKANRARWQFQDGSQTPSSPSSSWVKPSLTSQRIKYGQPLAIETTVTNSLPTAEVRITAEYSYPSLGTSNPYWNNNTGNFTRSPQLPGDKIWRIVARCTGTVHQSNAQEQAVPTMEQYNPTG